MPMQVDKSRLNRKLKLVSGLSLFLSGGPHPSVMSSHLSLPCSGSLGCFGYEMVKGTIGNRKFVAVTEP